jgi:tetratricopeptide (TPR) repeat protein
MPKLARLPEQERAPHSERGNVRRIRRLRHRYYAFLSYSHKDEDFADWLHGELEGFKVPRALAGQLTENGVIPKKLAPIFRDEHELAAADDLGEEIESALASSQFLIVLCSPNAAKSHWTNAEIEVFKRTRPDGCILAAITAGEPFASDLPGREHEECFPPALRHKYDRRGRPTGKRAEPLAADFRDHGEGRRVGFLKLVAGMLGVGLDALVQRETLRRHRKLAYLAAASLAGMAVTSTLAITALQARDAARDQRREAEGLIGFMLGDLKDKLEPIGKLDALDGVGSRVLAFYQKQDKTELSDAALSQRSRALSLMAQVSYSLGDLDAAVRLYQEARAGTEEALQRKSDDPQRLFDQAQNVFWIGEIARQRGDSRSAEAGAREYKKLAEKMVSLAPDNMKWRVEEQNAAGQLGIILYEQRRFAEAASQFEQSLQAIEALATADPKNSAYQKSLTEALAWLADAQMSAGLFDQAIAHRLRNIAMLDRLLSQTNDVEYRLKLIPAHRALGNLYAYRGQTQPAVAQLGVAVKLSEQLIPTEPNNRIWIEYGAKAHLNFAEVLLAANRLDQAGGEARVGCAMTNQLVARDRSAMHWRVALRTCLGLRTRIALATGDKPAALSLAQQTVGTARSIKTSDGTDDRFMLARSYRLLGDVSRSLGDAMAARTHWQEALEAIPQGAAERAAETSERVRILQRLGRDADAEQLASRLKRIGYRSAEA